jgi:hypothetical protein
MAMKLKDLSFLVVRVLSLYLFILGLNHLVNILNFAIPAYLQVIEHDTTYAEVFFVIGIPSFILIMSSVVLWFFAEKLSRYIIPKSSSESESTLQSKEIEGFVLSVIGLILLILSFTSSVRIIMNVINMLNQDIRFDNQGYKGYIYLLVEQVIRFLIGIILLLKAEGFASILRKIRNSGLNHLKKDV